MNYDNTTLQLWLNIILSQMYAIRNDLNSRHNLNLEVASLELTPDLNKKWGEWIPATRTIRLSARLFFTQPYETIITVLKHEMAHQIVSEVYNADQPGVVHGKVFENACGMLGIKAATTLSADQWMSSPNLDPVVAKIEKIMTKANCSSATEEEAQAFLQKAQELMVKYNVDKGSRQLQERQFIRRPVGQMYKKLPSYFFDICALLGTHYFVQYLKNHVPIVYKDTGEPSGKYLYYIELFGEKENIEIAAYIFDVLFRQGEQLWEIFKWQMKQQCIPIRGNFTKGSYLRGVFAG